MQLVHLNLIIFIWHSQHRTLTRRLYVLCIPLSLVHQNNSHLIVWSKSELLMLCVGQAGHWTFTSQFDSELDLGHFLQTSLASLFLFRDLLVQYEVTKEKKELYYEMTLIPYPCFGTVLALRDVFLHLVHLQLMREIPDQQLLWMRQRERETDGLSDRLVSFLFFFTFPSLFPSQSLPAFALFCMDPRSWNCTSFLLVLRLFA